MKYFDIQTVKAAIEHLQRYSANWLLPAFVFAANGVNAASLVDMSKVHGTDRFLDRYFNGALMGLPAMTRGNNLLRPRFIDIAWNRGRTSGDFVLQQDTKMWGNLFSSRGYREMAQRGYIEGEKAIVGLTSAFQAKFEEEIPASFHFEYFMVWLFAFSGFPDEIDNWQKLYDHLVKKELGLSSFEPQYLGRFKVSDPPLAWPATLPERPTDQSFQEKLAPKLNAILAAGVMPVVDADEDELPPLEDDDDVYVSIDAAIRLKESYSFLLVGPPGTGKSRYARQLAAKVAKDPDRILFLQFHPALGYDDFVEGFRPVAIKDNAGKEIGVTYQLATRLFMKFAEKAALDLDNTYVMVVDELNRGDVARIFGEVLTYLEPAYRKKGFRLAYSGDEVKLPANLIIVATANPYDRSVTDLDDALLRRFWVVELEPNAAILRAHLEEAQVHPSLVNRTVQLFNIVNSAMPNGFGHTSFLRVRTLDDLNAVWAGRVKMGLRRAYIHDAETYHAALAEIDALLTATQEEEAENEEKAAPGSAPEA